MRSSWQLSRILLVLLLSAIVLSDASIVAGIDETLERRWAVERAHSWMNCCRRILIRSEKKPDNYIPILHFACASIATRLSDYSDGP